MTNRFGRRLFTTAVAAQFLSRSKRILGQTGAAGSAVRPLPPDAGLYKGFEARWVRTQGSDIFLRHGGDGPPLLLLHGNPQTHACWHRLAEPLAKRFHVVVADLRGYGDSVGPADGGKNHENYSFRTMAQDQVEVMSTLGYERFYVAGHDRGARTAYRLALDHQERVFKVALLDIVPTRFVWNNTSRDWALNSWHWMFMAQPDDMFERMIEAIPAREFVLRHLGRTGKPAFFDDRAVAEYVRCFTPKTIHGSCEDYRAAAGIDLEHDEADARAGRRIAAPLLILWGRRSHTAKFYSEDPLSIWRKEADNVTGSAVDSGHYLAEEAHLAVQEAFERFFV
jgi:haloacetate dehalogenase